MLLSTAAINGFGAAILWVAQGRYISRIATDENKGTFNGIFWVFYMSTQLIGALFAAIVLQNTNPFTFYCIMTAICLLASLFFLFLRPVKRQEISNPDGQDLTNNDYERENTRQEPEGVNTTD